MGAELQPTTAAELVAGLELEQLEQLGRADGDDLVVAIAELAPLERPARAPPATTSPGAAARPKRRGDRHGHRSGQGTAIATAKTRASQRPNRPIMRDRKPLKDEGLSVANRDIELGLLLRVRPEEAIPPILNALTRSGGTLKGTARALDCHPATLARWIAAWPALQKGLRQARKAAGRAQRARKWA